MQCRRSVGFGVLDSKHSTTVSYVGGGGGSVLVRGFDASMVRLAYSFSRARLVLTNRTVPYSDFLSDLVGGGCAVHVVKRSCLVTSRPIQHNRAPRPDRDQYR